MLFYKLVEILYCADFAGCNSLEGKLKHKVALCFSYLMVFLILCFLSYDCFCIDFYKTAITYSILYNNSNDVIKHNHTRDKQKTFYHHQIGSIVHGDYNLENMVQTIRNAPKENENGFLL